MIWGLFQGIGALRIGLVGWWVLLGSAPSSRRLDSFWLFPTACCFPSPVSCSLNHGDSPFSPAHVFHCFSILHLQSYPWFIVLSATDLKMEGCLLFASTIHISEGLLPWSHSGCSERSWVHFFHQAGQGFMGLDCSPIPSSSSQYHISDSSSLGQSHVSRGNAPSEGCKYDCLFFVGFFCCLFCFVFKQ